VAVGKGKLFWFFSVGFVRRQKPNVFDRAVAFFQLAGNDGNMSRFFYGLYYVLCVWCGLI